MTNSARGEDGIPITSAWDEVKREMFMVGFLGIVMGIGIAGAAFCFLTGRPIAGFPYTAAVALSVYGGVRDFRSIKKLLSRQTPAPC